MASIFRTTVEHQLKNGGMTNPPNVGLPNAHDFLYVMALFPITLQTCFSYHTLLEALLNAGPI